MDRILDGAFASERFESALEHVVFPALRAVGDGWADGSIDVAMEHAASETVRRRLARFYDAVASDGAPDVIVGLPPGGRHEIGALAFAVAARRRGVGVLYLGADVPLASWLTAVTTSRAPIAVVAVVAAPDVGAADAVVAALRGAPGRPSVLLGGTRAQELRGRTDPCCSLARWTRRSRSSRDCSPERPRGKRDHATIHQARGDRPCPASATTSDRPTRPALTFQRRAAARLSYDALLDVRGLPLTKKDPVTPSTFGDDAR